MTDWVRDLQRLLGEIGERTPVTAPLNDIWEGNFGAVPGEIVGGAFRGYETLIDTTKFGTGAIIGGINEGLGALDRAGVPGAGFAYEPATSRALHEGALGYEPGPRAVWEQVRSEEPAWFQLPTEIGMDPGLAFGLPARGVAGVTRAGAATRAFEEAAQVAPTAGRRFVAGTAADISRGTDILVNQLPWEVTKRAINNPITRPIGRAGKRGIEAIVPNAFEFSPQTVVRRWKSDVGGVFDKVQSAQRGLPLPPAVIPGTTKSLSPFEDYDVPPFFDTEFDFGVPKRVKSLAWDSWQALRMSQPEMPGVNIPGMTMNAEGLPRFLGQRPGGPTALTNRFPGNPPQNPPWHQAASDVGAGSFLDRFRNPRMGFIAPPPGGYRQPGDFRGDEENLWHMATIGASIMLDYDNDVSNRLFGRLIQASEGVKDVKKAISDIYGPGGEPFVSGAVPQMREQLAAAAPESSMPDERFFSSWGWPEGEVPIERLEAIQRRLDAGIIDREQALAEIAGSGFHMSSPQATETAAGFGAGFLGATRQMDTALESQQLYNPEFGRNRPMKIDPATGRAAVPYEVQGQFDKNKAAYEAYMTQLFGPMPADEIDTLRRMSVEVIYGEMLNAAAPFTGGTEAATQFLRGTARATEGTKKLGGYADEADPRQIGNRMDEIEALGASVKYIVGRPTLKSLNTALLGKHGISPTRGDYERVMGRRAAGKGKLNNTHVMEMAEKLGETPFTPNRVGGPLPNALRLVEMFGVGKDLPAMQKDRLGFDFDKFYDGAAQEVMEIVGPGRYEDAAMFINLLGITSAGEGVEFNVRNTFRLFAEWKVGSPQFSKRLQDEFGLSPDQVQRLLTQNGEWSDPHQIFRKGIKSGMRDLTTKAFNEYVHTTGLWNAVQGGPKTHNYAGSVLLNVWRHAIDYALADSPSLHKTFKDGLDKAAKALAWDRHMSRATEHGTEVTEMQAIAMREMALIAADMADVSPERFQSGLWYLIKDQQGFTRIGREDDVAQALRRAWKENLPPERMAEVRLALDEAIPGLREQDPEGFAEVADDWFRQEAIYSIIENHLTGKVDDLARMTGERTPLQALFTMTDDVIGIVNRANAGAPPARKPNMIQLQDMTSDMLRRIYRGQDIGATFGWDGTNWVPESPLSGFAVALTSAGKTVPSARAKTSQRAMEKLYLRYTDLLDDPRYNENIKFGLFQFDDFGKEASFDLTLVVPDQRTAVDLGRKFNQQSIYDFATGEFIQTGGTGEPVTLTQAELRRILDSVYGKKKVDQPDIKEVFRRGVTLDEMNLVNPVSILNRRVLGPIMEKFHKQSVETLTGADIPEGATLLPGDTIGLPGPVPDDVVFDFEKIGQRSELSTQENMIANQVIDGEKVIDRMQRYYDEAERDVSIFEQSGIKWSSEASPGQRLKLAEGDAELKRIVAKYNKEGIDIGYARPRDIAVNRVGREKAKEVGVEYEDQESIYDLLKAAWGELALFSPKYHGGNIQGAILSNAIAGTFDPKGPRQVLSAYKYLRSGRDEVSRRESLKSLHVYQTFQKWGFDELPSWLVRGGVRGLTGSGRRSATGRIIGKVTKNQELGAKIGRPLDANADMGDAAELVYRGALAEDVLDQEMVKQMPAVEAAINRMAAKQGLENFEFSILNTINPVPGGPSPRRLKDHLQRMGFSEGYAERAGRNFAEARNRAENLAREKVNKHHFSYDRTNLDEFAGKFIPFHYWYSRALRFYGEEALRHPQLIMNYMRANDGIEDAQNDPGLSARQKGFLRLMGTPLGFSILMNPEAMFGVVKVFGLDSYENPDDTEHSAAKVSRWLQQRGLGLFPWFEGTLNLMGVFGDTFEPDLIGIRHKALIGAGINFMRSQLGMEPAGAPYAQAMGQVRGSISTFVSQFTPDWLTQPVMPRAGGSLTEASIDTVIESRVMARNPNLTNEQLLDIMADPDHPEYEAAYRDAAGAGVIQQLLNFTLPQNYRLKEDTRDVRAAQVSTIFEAAEKQGVSPYEFKPAVADVNFAARYEQLTGNKWQPGDYEDAQIKQELARSVPEAKPLAYQAAEFHNLGTPQQQDRFQKYQDILNGRRPETATLEFSARRELANAWASRLGYMNDVAEVQRLREVWEQTHPEFAQYKGWESQMWDLYNHMGMSLAEYRRQASQQNPNAARYFEETERWVRDNFPAEEVGQRMDQYTVSVDAFTAINGMAQSRYDQGPIPGVPPVDVTLPTITNQVLTQQPSGGNSFDWTRHVPPGYGVDTYGTWINR